MVRRKIARAPQGSVCVIVDSSSRKRLVTEGFDHALHGKKRKAPPNTPRLDGQGEATLIAMRLGNPPAGYGRSTLHLLAEQLVTLEVVDSIRHATVRQTLKKWGDQAQDCILGDSPGV